MRGGMVEILAPALPHIVIRRMPTRDVISIRLDTDKRDALDALARATDRDRSWLVKEAIDAYLAVHEWQLAHVGQGLAQAEAGQFATDAEVNAAFARWR
jgi:RHH-type transcriptional regulator, rel operon repressor / antitoxin RelB